MTNSVIDQFGNVRWYNSDGILHRDDGPAIEYRDGTKVWYINGKYHRDDGPAWEYPDGRKEWWINGKTHRDDGPAVEYRDGTKLWYIRDVNITEEVNQWIKDNNFPEYEEWSDSIKVMFKLKFG